MIIVFGNTKGGTGKSTLAVHVTVDLLYRGHRVVAIDGDGDQGTFSRYWENRNDFQKNGVQVLPMPLKTYRFSPSKPLELMRDEIESLKNQKFWDIVVIDTAGYDSELSRYAHSLADVLITPINDSAIDLDVLVSIQSNPTQGQLPLSRYATLVWEQRMKKTVSEGKTLQWLVLRNRMHSLSSRNQIQLDKILSSLARRIGFDLIDSVGERVIFRELFAYGLTVLDKNKQGASHEMACQEIRHITEKALRFYQKKESLGVKG
jgi:chromosome partitioning protein